MNQGKGNAPLARWLIAPGAGADSAVTSQLAAGLFASMPIFFGGVVNSIAVAGLAAVRHPTGLFLLWLAIEITLGICRLATVFEGRRALRLGAYPPIGRAVLLACAWAASVGFGTFISIATGDWVLASIACLSAAGMVAGICLRNFGTPKLVAIMMMLSLLPAAAAALLSEERVLAVIAVQLPIYMLFVGSAAFRLNRMMVDLMTTKRALEKSDAFNRTILESSLDYTLVLDETGCVAVCHQPLAGRTEAKAIIGVPWLQLLPPDKQDEGRRILEAVQKGDVARLTVPHRDLAGIRWFDLAVSPVLDGSGQVLIVARDITHQKQSEEHALWMANHDPLTRLPNREVLQKRLDSLPDQDADGNAVGSALLVLDIDNFKLINDTLGHDAGDALLGVVAHRLRSAVRAEDLVTRLGGDEFAIVFHARSEEEISAVAEKILASLRQPFVHNARLIECNASIGACLYPRDGVARPELMKAADVALYAAKTGGRGRLKIFQSSMRNDFQRRNSMVSLARRALETNGLIPHYQPKVCLGTGEITGFESLLRWRDPAGDMRLPHKLRAAFDDPVLSSEISDRMIDQVLADAAGWLRDGIVFGHVAINAAAAEFRQGKFADSLLRKMENARVPASCVQVEVTETVFFGRGADEVGRALRQLDEAGVRIALDDFGTGYASLSHLMQFPVHALKIDRSFVRGIGRNGEAEAITRAIAQLGRSLSLEIIAEGVEAAQQQAFLKSIGCQAGQGYLFSKAVPEAVVRQMVSSSRGRSRSA